MIHAWGSAGAHPRSSVIREYCSQKNSARVIDVTMVNQFQHTKRPPQAAGRPIAGPLYGATLLALAIFFVGLLLGRPSIDGFIVTSEITFVTTPATSGAKPTGTLPSDVAAPQIDLQQIANAFRAAERQVHTDRANAAKLLLSEDTLRAVYRRVHIRPLPQNSGFEISFRGQHQEWSGAFVDQLAREVVLTQAQVSPARASAAGPVRAASAASIRQARWLVDQTRHYERKTRLDMEEALSRHLEHAALPPREASADTSDSPPGDTPNTAATASLRRVNPTWEQKQDELAKKRDRLVEWYKTVTPNHPQARNLVIQIEQMQHDLTAIPQYMESPAKPPEPSAAGMLPNQWDARRVAFATPQQVPSQVTAPTGTDTVSSDDRYRLTSLEAYQQLQAGYETAVERREAAERRLAELTASGKALDQLRTVPPCVIHPAAVQGKLGGRPSGYLVLGTGLLALFCGTALFWRTRSLQGLIQINSIEQIQQTLALPIVGRIGIDPITLAVRRRTGWGKLVRGTVRASEIILALLIAAFLLSLLRDPPVAHELADNLLGTLIQRVATSIGI